MRSCTTKTQRLLQVGRTVLFEKFQLSPEISAHQLGADLLVQHYGGHCPFDVLSVLSVESSLNPLQIFHKLNCWSMTGVLKFLSIPFWNG